MAPNLTFGWVVKDEARMLCSTTIRAHLEGNELEAIQR